MIHVYLPKLSKIIVMLALVRITVIHFHSSCVYTVVFTLHINTSSQTMNQSWYIISTHHSLVSIISNGVPHQTSGPIETIGVPVQFVFVCMPHTPIHPQFPINNILLINTTDLYLHPLLNFIYYWVITPPLPTEWFKNRTKPFSTSRIQSDLLLLNY